MRGPRAPPTPSTPTATTASAPLSGLLAVRTELLQVGDEIVDIGVVGEPGKHHLGARYLRPRIFQVFLQGRLVPGEARILVGRRVIVALDRSCLAAEDAVEDGADAVLGAFADLVADLAFREHLLACCNILRDCRSVESDEGDERQT